MGRTKFYRFFCSACKIRVQFYVFPLRFFSGLHALMGHKMGYGISVLGQNNFFTAAEFEFCVICLLMIDYFMQCYYD
jgi:hypothetical protein